MQTATLIKGLRYIYGTDANVARVMNVSRGNVSDWGAGKKEMSGPTKRLAELLIKRRLPV